MSWLVSILVNLFLIFGLSRIIPGFSDLTLLESFWFVVISGILNWTIVPIVKLLTLPLNILTLGILGVLINAATVSFTVYILYPSKNIGFWSAVIVALIIGLVNGVMQSELHKNKNN